MPVAPSGHRRASAYCCAAKIAAYRQQYADNQNISFLPAIVSTSTRMHGEFLRLLFLQATGRLRHTSLPLECRKRRRKNSPCMRVEDYRGQKRNVLIVSVLMPISGDLTLRSNTQRRVQVLRVREVSAEGPVIMRPALNVTGQKK